MTALTMSHRYQWQSRHSNFVEYRYRTVSTQIWSFFRKAFSPCESKSQVVWWKTVTTASRKSRFQTRSDNCIVILFLYCELLHYRQIHDSCTWQSAHFFLQAIVSKSKIYPSEEKIPENGAKPVYVAEASLSGRAWVGPCRRCCQPLAKIDGPIYPKFRSLVKKNSDFL
jgi:hypothetical protein